MKTLLRIDCSSRVLGSHSRELASYFEQTWKRDNPTGKVIYRDLLQTKLPHIENATIEGFYTPKAQMSTVVIAATALSDSLIEELKSVDELLISTPLYNLNVPSNLKAYFDQVIRIGETFTMNSNGYEGLLKGKKAYLITVKGGMYRGTAMESLDFQEAYLKVILVHMGITVDTMLSLEGTSDEKVRELNKQEIQNRITALNL